MAKRTNDKRTIKLLESLGAADVKAVRGKSGDYTRIQWTDGPNIEEAAKVLGLQTSELKLAPGLREFKDGEGQSYYLSPELSQLGILVRAASLWKGSECPNCNTDLAAQAIKVYQSRAEETAISGAENLIATITDTPWDRYAADTRSAVRLYCNIGHRVGLLAYAELGQDEIEIARSLRNGWQGSSRELIDATKELAKNQ